MDPSEQFARLAALPDPPLDRLVALLGAHARPTVDPDATCARIDELAATFDGTDGVDLLDWMVAAGFRGNTVDYYEADNSYLDQVLDRRLGIPISLSVLAIEVGRRRGVALAGVGLPGEFVVREIDAPHSFLNPFRGIAMDAGEVAALVRRFAGPRAPLTPDLVAPSTTVEIVARMLNNLAHIFTSTGQADELAWTARLAGLLPPTSNSAEPQMAQALLRLRAPQN